MTVVDSDMTPMEVVDFHLDLLSYYKGDRGNKLIGLLNDTELNFAKSRGWDPRRAVVMHQPSIVQGLNLAQTFYVTNEMVQLAYEMSVDLEGMPLFEIDLPAANMLIVIDTRAGVTYGEGADGIIEIDKSQIPMEPGSRTQRMNEEDIGHTSTLKALLINTSDRITRQDGGWTPGEAKDTDRGIVIHPFSITDATGDPTYVWGSAPAYIADMCSWLFNVEWRTVPGAVPRSPGEITDDEGAARPKWSDDDGVLELPPGQATFRRFLLSLLLLMGEDYHTERQKIPRSAFRRLQRASVLPPEDGCLSITRLRRKVYNEAESTAWDEEGRRTYSHRWYVRPHWRRIRKGTPTEKAVYVHGYVKGPEHAPFIIKSKITRLES